MAWGIPDHKKVFRVFHKRKVELEHAIRHDFSRDKQVKAAERLREAKLKAFKSEFSRRSVLPASSWVPDEKARKWQALSIDEIISMFRKQKPSNQCVEPNDAGAS